MAVTRRQPTGSPRGSGEARVARGRRTERKSSMPDPDPARLVELLYVSGCPNQEAFLPHVRALLRAAGVNAAVQLVEITSDEMPSAAGSSDRRHCVSTASTLTSPRPAETPTACSAASTSATERSVAHRRTAGSLRPWICPIRDDRPDAPGPSAAGLRGPWRSDVVRHAPANDARQKVEPTVRAHVDGETGSPVCRPGSHHWLISGGPQVVRTGAACTGVGSGSGRSA